MKIAIPLQQGNFSQHFGGADTFALFVVDEATRTVSGPELASPPDHNRGVFPVWLRQQGATHVLAGGMGHRAIDIFNHHGIEVILGVQGTEPRSLVDSYLDGTLQATGEACTDHGYHDCGHGQGDHRHGHRA